MRTKIARTAQTLPPARSISADITGSHIEPATRGRGPASGRRGGRLDYAAPA